MEWMNEHLHENVVWHAPGNNALSGDHKGREAVLAYFAKSVQIALPEFDIHDVVASDDHVVALLSIKWRHADSDKTFDDRNTQIFHVAGGQALEVWTMADDLAGFDKFIGRGSAQA
jgi:ketosteroid isomerase-like protein